MTPELMRLDADQLDQLAGLIAARLHPAAHVQLVDAATLAADLGVSRAFIYSHSEQLGARRLDGSGRGRRVRFDPAEARAAFRTLDTPPASTPRHRRTLHSGTAGHVLRSRPRPTSGPSPFLEDDR
jgi:hypothetical protein